MDKRSFVATMLIFLIWGVWLFTQEPPPPVEKREAKSIPQSVTQDRSNNEPVAINGSKTKKERQKTQPQEVKATIRTLENEVLSVEIESLRTSFRKITLKNFSTAKDPKSPKVDLISEAAGHAHPFAMFLAKENSESQMVSGFREENFNPEKNAVTFTWEDANRFRIERTFELPSNSYHVNLITRVTNLSSGEIKEQQGISWNVFIPQGSEKGSFLSPPPDSWLPLSLVANSKLEDPKVRDGERKEIVGNITWSSLGSRYFLLAVIPRAVENAKVLFSREKSDDGSILTTQFIAPREQFRLGESKEFSYQIFLGPKEIDILEKEGHHLNRALHLGFFEFFALFLLRLMKFFHGFVYNWGLAIIVLTVLVKIAFFPLSHKSFKSMKEMQRIQPLLKDLQERFKNDKEQLNVQMMKIMREHKVNPLGGCLPMLVQMPIYFALYKVLYSSIELRHAPFFLWIQDLSVRDPFFVSPIMMGVAMFFQQRLSPQPPDPMQAKMMQIMPIMFTGFLLFLPSGLVIYIFCNTALSILQQWYINRTLGAKQPMVAKAVAELPNKA